MEIKERSLVGLIKRDTRSSGYGSHAHSVARKSAVEDCG